MCNAWYGKTPPYLVQEHGTASTLGIKKNGTSYREMQGKRGVTPRIVRRHANGIKLNNTTERRSVTRNFMRTVINVHLRKRFQHLLQETAKKKQLQNETRYQVYFSIHLTNEKK